jgi:hypothetical protein
MNVKITFFLISLFLFISSCADYKIAKMNNNKNYYSSNGFVLIYDQNLYINKIVNKKLDQNQVKVLHRTLKKNTPIKITNPENNISIITTVYSKTNFPKIFNAVVTLKTVNILKLDKNNPFIEILEIKKNKTFIAKEGSIFDEEKNVAEKAPVSEIKVDDLSKNNTKNLKKKNRPKKFQIIITDFYYKDSAQNLKDELTAKTKYTSFSITKVNDKKYRLLAGPFESFKALKNVYISLNTLGFENLNIINK